MPKTVILTGITGFIAKHIALQLLEAGYHVRGTSRNARREEEVRQTMRAHLSDPALADSALSFAQADLGADQGWDAAMAGGDYLMHTASPFPLSQPKDENDLIRPAVEGTVRVLEAGARAGISRVVLTSSSVAVMYGALGAGKTVYDEADWSEPEGATISAYAKSKTLAERAAWRLADELGLDLTTINPTLVLGPPLDKHYGSSLQLVERILRGKDPMLPDLGFAAVDVRDIAHMHVAALEDEAKIGERFIGVTGHSTFVGLADILRGAYPERRMPSRIAPKFLLRILALFDPAIRGILPEIGHHKVISADKARGAFGREFIALEEALLASAKGVVEYGDL